MTNIFEYIEINDNNKDKIDDQLKLVQSRAKTRLLDYSTINLITSNLLKKLHKYCPKSKLEGMSLYYQYGESLPRCYKWRPDSSGFAALFTKNKWYIYSVFRDPINSKSIIKINIDNKIKDILFEKWISDIE